MNSTAHVCDAVGCGQPAETIHVIPNVPDCREVKLACSGHSFTSRGDAVDVNEDRALDAYWFEIGRWQSGEMEKHIRDTKINGDTTAAKIAQRLA